METANKYKWVDFGEFESREKAIKFRNSRYKFCSYRLDGFKLIINIPILSTPITLS